MEYEGDERSSSSRAMHDGSKQEGFRPCFTSVSLLCVGAASFFVCSFFICSRDIGYQQMFTAFYAETDQRAYIWSMSVFATACFLLWVTYAYDMDATKYQLAHIAGYINVMAAFTELLGFLGYAPIHRDVWGHHYSLLRLVMWLHTTPAMIHLLSVISDFSRLQVWCVVAANVVMIAAGMVAHVVLSKPVSVASYALVSALFCFVVVKQWKMFNAAIVDAKRYNSQRSLQILRLTTVGFWFLFPLIWITTRVLPLSISCQEWLWCAGDVFCKAMYSSSLLHGNFLTIEGRRQVHLRHKDKQTWQQAIAELQELVRQKDRFLSSMSHELRTPLNGIIGLSEALLGGSCNLSNEAHKVISTIKTSGSRLLTLVNDILDAATMKKGALVLKHERLNLRRIVDDVIDVCQPLARRGVRLLNDVPDSITSAVGDSGRIIQIFHNLIGNCCKFTHKGAITISARLNHDEQLLEISVRDTGIGIPHDKYDQIFVAFEQVDKSTTRKYGGTGLGLSLVKQLVEAHHGTIYVTSNLGSGTTFTFTLRAWNSDVDSNKSTQRSRAESRTSSLDDAASHFLQAQPSSWRGAASPPQSRRLASVSLPSLRQRATVAAHQTSLISGNTGGGSNVGGGGGGLSDGPTGGGAASSEALSRRQSPHPLHRCSYNDLASQFRHSSRNPTRPDDPPRQLLNSSKHDASSGLPLCPAKSDGSSHSDTDVLQRARAGPDVFRLPPSSGRKCVLSVDDDPVNQLVVQNVLGPVGFKIHQAMDGQEALDMLEGGSLPDIILLDVMMPSMSGQEVCRQLRLRFPHSCIPVIMLSARSQEAAVVECLSLGANDYVVKPFRRQELIARIDTHLRFRESVYQAVSAMTRAANRRGLNHTWRLPSVNRLDAPRYSAPLPLLIPTGATLGGGNAAHLAAAHAAASSPLGPAANGAAAATAAAAAAGRAPGLKGQLLQHQQQWQVEGELSLRGSRESSEPLILMSPMVDGDGRPIVIGPPNRQAATPDLHHSATASSCTSPAVPPGRGTSSPEGQAPAAAAQVVFLAATPSQATGLSSSLYACGAVNNPVSTNNGMANGAAAVGVVRCSSAAAAAAAAAAARNGANKAREAEMAHRLALAERELAQVSQEADRLQSLVDELTSQLMAMTSERDALASASVERDAELALLRGSQQQQGSAQLQRQLLALQDDRAAAEARWAELRAQLEGQVATANAQRDLAGYELGELRRHCSGVEDKAAALQRRCEEAERAADLLARKPARAVRMERHHSTPVDAPLFHFNAPTNDASPLFHQRYSVQAGGAQSCYSPPLAGGSQRYSLQGGASQCRVPSLAAAELGDEGGNRGGGTGDGVVESFSGLARRAAATVLVGPEAPAGNTSPLGAGRISTNQRPKGGEAQASPTRAVSGHASVETAESFSAASPPAHPSPHQPLHSAAAAATAAVASQLRVMGHNRGSSPRRVLNASSNNSSSENLSARLAASLLQEGGGDAGSRKHRPSRNNSSRTLSKAPGPDIAIASVLAAAGLSHLSERFMQEEVTPELLPMLDDGAMQELGVVSMGARLRLRMAVEQVVRRATTAMSPDMDATL